MLDQLSKLGLGKLWDLICNWDWDPDNIDMNRLIMDAIRISLSTQTKVDDTMLRKRQTDLLPVILEKLATARASRPPLIELIPN